MALILSCLPLLDFMNMFLVQMTVHGMALLVKCLARAVARSSSNNMHAHGGFMGVIYNCHTSQRLSRCGCREFAMLACAKLQSPILLHHRKEAETECLTAVQEVEV